MFNNISGSYDFLNHFLSLGIDRGWRKRAVQKLQADKPQQVLDIATGTGDFALACLKLNPQKVTGVDISEQMLEVGRSKMRKRKLDQMIELKTGDSEHLQFEDNSFDAAVVGFGVRNFENLQQGLREIHRVLKPGSKLVVLEFSKPHVFPLKQLYGFYFSRILPTLGALMSKDKRAYAYLHESVEAFPEGGDFLDIMKACGFASSEQDRLMGGIASIYVGKK